MTRERRAFARVELDLPASMYLYQMDMYHDGAIIDLSLGGCFLPVEGDIPLGEKCQLILTTGIGLETESVEIAGTIARCTAHGVGIKFSTGLSSRIKAILKKVMAEKLQIDA
ncbi:PilZ domain-containing protein [Desulfopila sp. IMCC35008]|uniref:PilZ domain-containing protein n=1 Tax=Desulfopila sp. IMCC35008 TaxID=2653858 RepID=UPI0013D39F18|nr:PilZ domain-containing protein [Desulfopila sp. IMCC35008]